MDLCKKISLQHAENLYRAEDDVEKQRYSLDIDVITSEDVIALRRRMEEAKTRKQYWQGWAEKRNIDVTSLPADSLISVVSKKYACDASHYLSRPGGKYRAIAVFR